MQFESIESLIAHLGQLQLNFEDRHTKEIVDIKSVARAPPSLKSQASRKS